MISQSQICCNTTTFCTAAIFVNTAIQPAVGCYNPWANLQCSSCSPLGGTNGCETGLLNDVNRYCKYTMQRGSHTYQPIHIVDNLLKSELNLLNSNYAIFGRKWSAHTHVHKIKSMAYRKTAVTPLLTHWISCSLALNHLNCVMLVDHFIHAKTTRWLSAILQ